MGMTKIHYVTMRSCQTVKNKQATPRPTPRPGLSGGFHFASVSDEMQQNSEQLRGTSRGKKTVWG